MKVAHVAGQYQSLVDEAELYPYWQYHTQEDERVRGSHAVLNRKVFRWDDPFWDTHFPPNGWQCRCYVRSLDDDDLEEKGLKVTDSRDLKTREDKSAGGHSKLTYIIDGKEATTADGWNYNPGKVNQQIDNVADNKIGEYDAELGQQVKDDLNKEEEPTYKGEKASLDSATWIMMGVFCFSAAVTAPMSISILATLKAPTAILCSEALSKSSFIVTKAISFLRLGSLCKRIFNKGCDRSSLHLPTRWALRYLRDFR